jgi:AraC-like DNA-binding protein
MAQAVLLSLVLLRSHRGHAPANRVLAVLLLTIGAQITISQLTRSEYIASFPHLIRVQHPLDFAPGVLLYLYVRVSVERRRLQRRDLVHFIPAAVCAAYLLPYYVQPGAFKLADLDSAAFTTWYYVRSALAIVIGGCYVIAAVTLALKNRAGDPQLQFLSFAFLGVLAVALCRFVLDLLLPSYMPLTGWFLPVMGAAILYVMAYLGLRDPATSAGNARKYEQSSLTYDRAEAGLQRLLKALEEEKIYLDADITLQSVARRLAIPAPHVSQIVNERLNQTFSDLINRYRVEEVKRRLIDPACQHYSLLAIAEEAGFRSKSSFNAIFKKHTQMTPSEYRKALDSGPAS